MKAETMESPVISEQSLPRSARKVALKLSGVSSADRLWVLAQLTASHREQVEKAYLELRRIRGDAQLDFALFTDPGAIDAVKANSELPFNQLQFLQIKNLMDELPPLYVAAVLSSGLWQNGQRYLDGCDKRRRQLILEVRSPSVSSASALALVEALARRVETETI